MLDTIETKAAGGDSLPAAPAVRTSAIAIVGSNPHTKDAAPFGDPSWAIYSCSPDNSPYGRGPKAGPLPRTDQIFEVHLPLEDPSRPFPYLQWVSQQPFVWVRDQHALVAMPGARLYPEKELKGTSTLQRMKIVNQDGSAGEKIVEVPNHDGLFDPCQFTSSIAYMLAKAIVDAEADGIRMIGLWGIMQASENEYAYQRPGIQYFIHEAMKRGIKVVANRESCLFDMPQWKW